MILKKAMGSNIEEELVSTYYAMKPWVTHAF